jgi:3-oxoacyl-[acyl-carrier-protein] synthase II
VSRRVVVTGVGGLTPLGHDWNAIALRLRQRRNAVIRSDDWATYDGLATHLAAPAAPFDLPAHFDRKRTRSMGRVALLGTLATERALASAGLLGDPLLAGGRVGIAYGSASGSPPALGELARMQVTKRKAGITGNTYLKLMSQTAAVNIGVFFGITGRVIPTSSACTSSSQAIGYAFESIRHERQTVMLAGGAEELDVSQPAVFETLFATSRRNEEPGCTPRPFDVARDGLVIGEGAVTLVLEEFEHARARGATILAEIVGYGTNSDGQHVTYPEPATMSVALRLALEDASLPPSAIGYVNAHGTATEQGDIAESEATHTVFGERIPISSLKSYVGHTLGACGALEAWFSVEMARAGWFAPTINLETVDPRCAPLDYIVGEGRVLDCEFIMSNNFAFGGINTSLIFRRL